MMAYEQDLYDSELARALNLHVCRESQSARVLEQMRQFNRHIHSSVTYRLANFMAEMCELGQKIKSAGRKINALIFLPGDMIVDSHGELTEAPNTLRFTPILIHPTLNFAPPSEPVSMVVDETVKKNREVVAIKAQLEKQLNWFQKYGQEGALLSSKAVVNSDKPKRHLSLVSETSQAA